MALHFLSHSNCQILLLLQFSGFNFLIISCCSMCLALQVCAQVSLLFCTFCHVVAPDGQINHPLASKGLFSWLFNLLVNDLLVLLVLRRWHFAETHICKISKHNHLINLYIYFKWHSCLLLVCIGACFDDILIQKHLPLLILLFQK